jgi:hypothetical protein
MKMVRWFRRSVPLATVVLASAAPMALAQWGRQEPNQGRELFEWTGSVDREKQIVMRGDRVWTNDVGRTEPRAERARTFSAIPRQDGRVVVRLVNGRGDAQVIEQPTASNNYQTVVRIVARTITVSPRTGKATATRTAECTAMIATIRAAAATTTSLAEAGGAVTIATGSMDRTAR